MSEIDLAGSPLPSSAPLAGGIAGEHASAQAWSLRCTALAIGALGLFALAAFGAWVVSDMVVPWDSKSQFYPFFRFMADGFARGDAPLWNPYHYGGHPSVADPQSFLFTPTMALFALIAPKASMTLFDGIIFAHLFAGGLGMLLLFRRRGWRPAGGVLAGMIFMLGGVAASRLQHTGIIISYSFFPLALLALEETIARKSWAGAAIFGLLSALMLLGRDQTALLLAFALGGAFVFHISQAKKPLRLFTAMAPLMFLSGAIIIAVLAAPSLLTMQFLAQSNRPGIAYGVAAAGSLHPANFATLFVGNIFGSTDWGYRYWGPGYEATELADFTDRTINYLFAGMLPALLILWHGLAGGRLFGRSVRYFALLGLAAALYAVGRYTPVFGFLFDHVPGIALYRRPADAAFLLNIAVAAASGYLLHRYMVDGLPRPFRRLNPALAAALALLAIGLVAWTIGAALGFAHAKDQLAQSLSSVARALGVAAALLVILVLAATRGDRMRGRAAALLVFIAGGELILSNAATSLNAEPASRYALYDGAAPRDQKGLDRLAQLIHDENAKGHFPRVEVLGLNGPWQNASMVVGIENTLGYNPLRIADYARAVGPGENAGDPNLRQFPGTFRGYRCSLASLLGLEYLVLDRPLDRLPRHIPRPRATPVYEGRDMHVYRLGAPMPRAFVATAVKPVERETVLAEGAVPEFDRRREALIDEESMGALARSYPEKAAADAPASTVRITSHGNTRIAMEVDSPTGGVLVLHDIHYPGWQARVDGEAKPVLRANILFRGVEVGPGRHEVVFEFKPFALSNLVAAASRLWPAEEEGAPEL